MKIIDLRSDTVTRPTEAMRQAMYAADVGDDVYREDPTVNRLEETAARITGKENALFTVSGTMSNLIAVLAQTRHGNEILLGSESHILWYEVGGSAAIGGVVMRNIPNKDNGEIDIAAIERAIRPVNIHYPETALLCLENTHNRCGGSVLSPEYTDKAVGLAHGKGLKVHLDGARIFNASVALGTPVTTLTRGFDSVSFCVSKGLSAPVGSLLCGTNEFVARARKWRKMLGGGMRQAGVIAAAGLVALDTMIVRLAEDHKNARKLADGLGQIKGISIDTDRVQTNIVMFDLIPGISPESFVSNLAESGVKVSARGGSRFRAVTHYDINDSDIDSTLGIIRKACSDLLRDT